MAAKPKVKPTKSASDIARMVVATTQAPASEPRKAAKLLQINFSASEEFARLISEASIAAGGTRRLIAGLMKSAGHKVPEGDLNPARAGRRRWT